MLRKDIISTELICMYVYLNDVDIALTFFVDSASWLDELRYSVLQN